MLSMNWQKIVRAGAAMVGLMLCNSLATADTMTVTNGGFEQDVIASELWGYHISFVTPSGWTQADFTGTSGDHEVAGILHRPTGDIAQSQVPLYAAPVDGSNQMFGMELDWDGISTFSTHTGIYQDIGKMATGEKYSFNATLYSNGEGSPSSYRVSFFDVTDNRELAAITQANFDPSASGALASIAATFNYTATAADNGDTLRLMLLGTPGSANQVRTGIDAITVTTSPIPEPGTLILLMTGIAGLLAYAWRKQK